MMSSTSQLVRNESNSALNRSNLPEKFPKLSTNALFVFSIFNFLLWVMATALQVTIISTVSPQGLDVVGHGIWVGLFYGITGFFGYSASYKQTRSQLTGTLIYSVFSICGSIVCMVLSGIMATSVESYKEYCTKNQGDCIIWEWMEWLLFGVSILAFTVNVDVVIIVGIGISSNRKLRNPEALKPRNHLAQKQSQLQQQPQQQRQLQQQQQQPYVSSVMGYGYNTSSNNAYQQQGFTATIPPRREEIQPNFIGY